MFLAYIPVTFFECRQGAWYDAIKGDLVKAWGEDWGVHPFRVAHFSTKCRASRSNVINDQGFQ